MKSGPADDGPDGVVKSILDWAECTEAAASRFSAADFEIFGTNIAYYRASHLQKLGQLYEINPPSQEIIPYFKKADVTWRREYRRFVDPTGFFLVSGIKQTVLSILSDFYVRTQVASLSPPPFVERFRSMAWRLQSQHATCCCKWVGVTSRSGDILWREYASDGKGVRERCPYEIVLNELEARWGRWTEVYENRRVKQEVGRLIAVSQSLRDYGFIQLASDQAASQEEFFERLRDPFSNYTWQIAPSVLRLLNDATEWQIESEVLAMKAWLDKIDSTTRPAPLWHFPIDFVRVQQYNLDTRLMRWVSHYPILDGSS
ncbi:hypothetical protein [Burkholderia territorii]|uniref:hypothetical protein n=1 Tax=Burkholderia territorii TaxID=1503055 RepID=UPI0012D9C8B8|nr:hypothetical protein [Burkholderia territorii]